MTHSDKAHPMEWTASLRLLPGGFPTGFGARRIVLRLFVYALQDLYSFTSFDFLFLRLPVLLLHALSVNECFSPTHMMLLTLLN